MKTSHPDNGRDALDHMTKPQLRQQLADVLDTLKTDETQLATYENQFQQTQAKLAELEGFKEKTALTEKKLEKALASLEERSAQARQLQEETDGLKRVNKSLQKDNEELKSQLQAAEKKASQDAEATHRQLRETEQQQAQVEGKNRDLENRLQELQKTVILRKEEIALLTQPEEMSSENMKSAPASFSIVFYPQENNYRGRIRHILSNDAKPFKGLDQNTILQFITDHLPPLEKQRIGRETAVAAIPETPPAPEIPPNVGAGVLLSELNALQPGIEAPRNFVICRKEPFQLQVKVDLSNVRAAGLPLVYYLKVYAQHLQTKGRELIGEATRAITAGGVFPVRVQAKALAAGTYRLQADLTSKFQDGKVAPYGASIEGGLVQID